MLQVLDFEASFINFFPSISLWRSNHTYFHEAGDRAEIPGGDDTGNFLCCFCQILEAVGLLSNGKGHAHNGRNKHGKRKDGLDVLDQIVKSKNTFLLFFNFVIFNDLFNQKGLGAFFLA